MTTTLRTNNNSLHLEGNFPTLTAELEHAVTRGIIIRDINLTEADLCLANLDGATFINVNFHECDLTGANMSECSFTDCNFTLTRLHDTCFCYSDFESCRFDDAFFSSTDVSEARFRHCLFRGHGTHNLNLARAYRIESCAIHLSACNNSMGNNILTQHKNLHCEHTKDVEIQKSITTFD